MRLRQLPGFSLTLFMLCASNSLLAQDSGSSVKDAPRWYQVEMIVFEHRLFSRRNDDLEAWPRDLRLSYPPGAQHLLTTEELESIAAAREAEKLASEDPEGALLNETAARQTPPATQTPPTLSEPSGEKPFIALGKSVSQLNTEMRAIDREREVRVLAHRVWRQPIIEKENSPAILLIGGNQYDDHFELEGSVTLSVSRFLHIDTDLWLTRFEANLGQEETIWPRLPSIPEKKIYGSEAEALYSDSLNQLDSQIHSPLLGTFDRENQALGGFQLGQDSFASDRGNPQPTPLQKDNYAVVDIVKFKQSRRMRSGELHYLDHPRMGLLLRIDKYELPEKQAPAEDELAENSLQPDN